MLIRFPIWWRCVLVLLGMVGSLLAVPEAHASITGDFGNKPVMDRDWPAGALEVANLKTRVGWWEGPPFGGGQYTFLYRGDTKAFNEALAKFAEIKAPALELEVLAGPHESFWLQEHPARGEAATEKAEKKEKRDPRVDWEFVIWTPRNFHHLFNNPASLFGSDQPNFRKPIPAPKVNVYIGGGQIDWKQVKVPRNVRVVGTGKRLKEDKTRLSGRVYDMVTSKPVSGARITVAESTHEGVKEVRQAETNEDGEIAIDDLPPGTYAVRIESEGHAPLATGWDQYIKGEEKELTIQLSPVATLKGKVIDSSGQPIAGAKVHTFTVLGMDGRGYNAPTRPEATTDDQGRFELKLPTGYAQISARKPGLYHSWTEILPVGDHPIPRDEQAEVVITMVQTATVTVTVKNAGGKPVAGKMVAIEPVGKKIGKWSGSGVTNEKGVAEIRDVPPGEYHVTDSSYPSKKSVALVVKEGKPEAVSVTW